MHFASFEVVSIKDLKLFYRGHLSYFWTSTKKGETWDSQSMGKNQNGITWSVFGEPQSHKNVITWPEFLNRRLKPTVREAGRNKMLVHGHLRWIVCWCWMCKWSVTEPHGWKPNGSGETTNITLGSKRIEWYTSIHHSWQIQLPQNLFLKLNLIAVERAFYQNALHLTRLHCTTFYQSASRHEQHEDVTPLIHSWCSTLKFAILDD